ncbi:hypothetical protein J3A83DRAFT_4356743 [Scleroderma citrinum]
MPPETEQKVWKPCTVSKPHNHPPKPSHDSSKSKQAPSKTLAIKKTKHRHSNLTLNDWLTVVAYHDQHQPITQAEVVKHFANKEDGSLIFDQSTLSHHLSEKGHQEDTRQLESNPTALSSKWIQAVTCPDVEKALFKWVMHIEEKGEQKFEITLGVPEEERLKSMGWIQNFCKM